MNQAAKDLIARCARRSVAQDRIDWRRGYQRKITNPIELDSWMGQWDPSSDQAWGAFAGDYPNIAELDGAAPYFDRCYGNAVRAAQGEQ